MGRQVLTAALLTLMVFLLMQALPGVAFAQSGKLAGTVTDAATGDPIPGATVALEGTTRGTTTDVDGQYVIVGLSPAVYTIRFSFVGYTTQVIDGVRVTSDRTTSLDVALSSAVVEGEEVLVEDVRPVVDANQTTSRAMVTGEEMARLPVSTLEDAVSHTANAYKGFVRGSRRYETRTIIEGIDITDAFYTTTPTNSNQGYSGLTYNNTNRSGLTSASNFTINPDIVSEVTVNTGATDARHATASGGVIAVSLEEGRGPLRGSFMARVAPSIRQPGPDSLAFYPTEEAQAYLALRDQLMSDPGTQAKGQLFTWTPDRYEQSADPEVDMRGTLAGSITKDWSFLASGQWFQTNGFQPNQFSKRIGGTVKSTYNVSRQSKLTALAMVEDRGLWGNWNNRVYHDYWRYYLEGVAQNDGGSYLGSLTWTQILSSESFFSVQAYRTYSRLRHGYVDDDGNGFTDPGEDGDFLDFRNPDVISKYIGPGEAGKMFSTNIANAFADVTGIAATDGTRLRTAQPVPYSEDSANYLNAVKLDYTNQITFNHFLQAGAEFKLRQFDYEQVYGIDQDGSKLNPGVEPFAYNNWTRNPWEVALYVSDRMEYGGLIVNLGLRLEVVDRDMDQINDFFFPFRRDSVDVNGQRLARNFFDRGESVPTDFFLNPRIGVSHPIGTNAAMYFSYARNQQLTPFSQLYEWYDGNNSNSPFFVYQNPAQKPITSNNYELGMQWEFSPGWGADVNAYMRSIDNYGRTVLEASNRTPEGATQLVGTPHRFSTSFGYADSRGIELVLRRTPLRLAQDVMLGLNASYTYATVEAAVGAGGDNGFADNDPTQPTNRLPFDVVETFPHFAQNVRGSSSTIESGYDRRHRLTLRSVATLPYQFSVGINANLESGFLYQKQIDVDPRDRELRTGPTNYQIDLRFEKRFAFTNRFGTDVFLDVINLTDRFNVIAYNSDSRSNEAEIFERTGNPGSRLIQRDGSALYGPARNIHFGARVRF